MKKSGTTLLMMALLGVTLSACRSEPPITDEHTKYDLPIVDKLAAGERLHFIHNESMALSKQYLDVPVVVDLTEYSDRPIARGDVVYFRTDAGNPSSGYDVARVVGLPGERIVIKNGRISIDGHKLDTFYGHISKAEPANNNAVYDRDIVIPDKRFFMIGDVWFRNFSGSFIEGPIEGDRVKGKVVGWVKSHIESTSPALPAEYLKTLTDWYAKQTDQEKLKAIWEWLPFIDWNVYEEASGNKTSELLTFLYEYRGSIGEGEKIQLLQATKGLDGALSETYSAIVGDWFLSDMPHMIQALTILGPEKANSVIGYIAYHCSYGDIAKAMNDANASLQSDWITPPEKTTVQALMSAMKAHQSE
ncbi:signal peptidase I [Cohnella endophytica]|uniref:Signal peptidase I n=1 Tax=Cohnella endophytica TaxID=2419778 RepID=A0A494Y7H0_9BACL|nr:signal peptidase I [Cohnella endophytica]RKP58023.1 signal peptidase I [Cohnella endophytica]